MAEEYKEIQARIWTKVDTLENWNNNPLLLGPGELALVTNGQGVPMNMKWGDKTTRKRFSELPFAIAYDQGQFVAVNSTALPSSDGNVHYSLVGEGTYTREGQSDVVVPTGYMGVIVDDGTTWSLGSSVALPSGPVENEFGVSTTNAISQAKASELNDAINKDGHAETVFGNSLTDSDTITTSGQIYLQNKSGIAFSSKASKLKLLSKTAGNVTLILFRPNELGGLDEVWRTVVNSVVGSNEFDIDVDVEVGDKFGISGGRVSYLSSTGIGNYFSVSSSRNPSYFLPSELTSPIQNVSINYNVTIDSVKPGLLPRVDGMETTVNENTVKIDKISNDLVVKEDFSLKEYSGSTLAAVSSGTLFMSKLKYSLGQRIKKIYIYVDSVAEAVTNMNFRLYGIQTTGSATTAANNVIKSKSDLITIPVNRTVNANGAGVYEFEVDIYIGANLYPALAVQGGVSLRYGSTSSIGGFYYNFSQSNILSKNIDDTLSGTVQNFTTSAGWGYDSIRDTSDTINGENVATKDFVNQSILNYLSGKKMNVAGDSTVKGHTLPANQVWDYLIAQRNKMTVNNYGINGNRLTNTGGTGTPLVLRYMNMDLSADFILINIGTNDAAASVAIGSDSSTDITEFKGALNVLCDGLLTMYPNKKIGFLTPELRTAGYQAYITAIEVICAKYSIPVFNNAKQGGVCWTNNAQVTSITLQDSYHLNAAGMLRKSYTYEEFIRSL